MFEVSVRAHLAWIIVAVASFSGCAPIVGSIQLVNADIAVDAAKSAGAERYATYEYTMAKEYLKKAREESGYSDFAAAREYAEKAMDYAETARARALDSGDVAGVKAARPESVGSAPAKDPAPTEGVDKQSQSEPGEETARPDPVDSEDTP